MNKDSIEINLSSLIYIYLKNLGNMITAVLLSRIIYSMEDGDFRKGKGRVVNKHRYLK